MLESYNFIKINNPIEIERNILQYYYFFGIKFDNLYLSIVVYIDLYKIYNYCFYFILYLKIDFQKKVTYCLYNH